jgi:hypothetical protein
VTDHEDIALARHAGAMAASQLVPAWEAVGDWCQYQQDDVLVLAFVDGFRSVGAHS